MFVALVEVPSYGFSPPVPAMEEATHIEKRVSIAFLFQIYSSPLIIYCINTDITLFTVVVCGRASDLYEEWIDRSRDRSQGQNHCFKKTWM